MDKLNKEILNLAVPSIISNITVPLLGLVDVAIVGHIGNETYIGAIAIGSMLFNVVYWVFGFLRMGTSGMTSQAYGRRDLQEAMRLLVRVLTVAFAIALCFIVCQMPLLKLGVWLMNTPEESVSLVKKYFLIVIWGAPATLGLYGITGWFVGMQNTRIPMMVAILQNITNIIVSLCLVFGWGMQIEGVATGTLVAQWTGFLFALLLWRIKYKKLLKFISVRVSVSSLRSQAADWWHFFAVNRDIFLRTLCLVAVNMFFTSAGASFGATILAVNTLLMQLFMLFSYVMDGFAYAGEAMTGKYLGAANYQALHLTVRRLFVWGGGMVCLFTVVYAVGGSAFLSLLTSDEGVVTAAVEFLPWAIAVPAFGVAAFIYDGVFIGTTETRGMLVSSAVATVAFFAVYLLLEKNFGNHALWLAFIIFLMGRGGVQWWVWRKNKRKSFFSR